MKLVGGLIAAVVVGVLALWLLLALFVGALKVVGVLLALGLGAVAFFVVEKLIGKGR